MTNYVPRPEDKFAFGLWTVGSRGADPFGPVVGEHKTPAELIYLLGEVGAYGVNFHDKDKAARWNADQEIQALVAEINAEDAAMSPFFGKYSGEKAKPTKAHSIDRSLIAARGLKYEKLDQLTIEILLGVR